MSATTAGATWRVVIAEDDPDIRALVSIAVKRAGLDLVAEAVDGGAAFEAVARLHPDLAVLDVSMPTMTGLEVCRAVRADPTLDTVRLILLSAGVDDHAKALGLAAGADEYYIKPFSPKALAARLTDLMDDSK